MLPKCELNMMEKTNKGVCDHTLHTSQLTSHTLHHNCQKSHIFLISYTLIISCVLTKTFQARKKSLLLI